jgi:DNA polymerase-1
LHDLELWKALHESPGLYAIAKKDRRELKNYLNNAKNVQIQSLAASIVNQAAIKVARAYKREGLDAVIVANIHDELLVSAVQKHQHRAAHILQQEMENIMPLTVQLKAVPSIGQRYGEIK